MKRINMEESGVIYLTYRSFFGKRKEVLIGMATERGMNWFPITRRDKIRLTDQDYDDMTHLLYLWVAQEHQRRLIRGEVI